MGRRPQFLRELKTYVITTYPHVCRTCSERFKIKSNLTDHEYTTHDGCFKCDVEGCTVAYRTKDDLTLHNELAHSNPKRPYHCDEVICASVFKTKNYLTRHEQYRHCQKKSFKCGIGGCGTTFKTKGALRQHKNVYH